MEKIHIGSAIEKRVKELDMTQSSFGAKIGVPHQNIRRIFEKGSIDTDKLLEISCALKYNFFELYCELDDVRIIGNNNQVNERGAHHNTNGNEDIASLKKEIEYLKQRLEDKDEIIQLLKSKN